MTIALLGNYPPRRCGIATFTQHLADGMRAAATPARPITTRIIAVNDGRGYDYPAEVTRTLDQQAAEDYAAVADELNADARVDAVVIQHEFGIFGGRDGEYVLRFAERLRKPLLVTLHTVLRSPSANQRLIVQRLGRCADKLVVMSRLATRILEQVYRVDADKVARVPHGAPDFDYGRRDAARAQLGLGNRHTVLTFGLLGRGKGIETAIEALPALAAVAPDFTYVLLGRTHPHVIAHEGEAYRESLWARVEELGLTDNVRFADEYVDEATLADYLLAADTYVLPYPNPAQITSGTLAYAVASGAAVLSTPFWHAEELLAEGRGELFGFGDAAALGRLLCAQVQEPERHRALRRRARAYGRTATWQQQGAAYVRLAAEAVGRRLERAATTTEALALPPLDLQHVRRLSDDTGMLQHATFHLPNPQEGYCLDDNARALIFTAQALELGADRHELEPLLDRYLSLLLYLQRPDGQFCNFIGYDRGYLEGVGSPDSFGRAVWALGRVLRSPAVAADHKDFAWELYLRARPHITGLRSLRAVAFSVLGLYNLCESEHFSENVAAFTREVAQFMLDEYEAASGDGWQWFESVLTYGNAVLPLAMLRAAQVTGDKRYLTVAAEATRFLEDITFEGDVLHPVGCHTQMRRGESPSRYDQQPLDVMAMVYLYVAWYEHTGSEAHLRRAEQAYRWFEGVNDLGLPLFNARRGSCFDGLMEHGINQNQGAESTLAFWLSRNTLAAVQARTAAAKTVHDATGQLADDDDDDDPMLYRSSRTPLARARRGSGTVATPSE